jgi:hypothetical protein
MALKKCKSCGNTIARTARRCPHCGTYLWTTGRIVFAIFILLFGYFFFQSYAQYSKSEPSVTSDQTGLQPVVAVPPTSKSEPMQAIFKEGDNVCMDEFCFTVWKSWWSESLGSNPFIHGKKANAMYLFVDMTIQNNDHEPRIVRNFKIVDQNGSTYEIYENSWLAEGAMGIYEKINPSVSRRGIFVYDLPQNRQYHMKLISNMFRSNAAYVQLDPNGHYKGPSPTHQDPTQEVHKSNPLFEKVELIDVSNSDDLVKVIRQYDKIAPEDSKHFKIAMFDINNDGKKDIVYTCEGYSGSGGYTWYILINKGSGKYEESEFFIPLNGLKLDFSGKTVKGMRVPYFMGDKLEYIGKPTSNNYKKTPNYTEGQSIKVTATPITSNVKPPKSPTQQDPNQMWPQSYAQYSNERYGFCIEHPTAVTIDPPPTNGDGRRFHDPYGFLMIISGTNNTLDYTIETEMKSQSKDLEKITYQAKGKNWFVLSGYKGPDIVYLKTYVGEAAINHLYIKYPALKKEVYAETVTRISRSFKPGDLDVAH